MKIIYNIDYRKSFKWYHENYSISTQYQKIKTTGQVKNTKVIWQYLINFIICGLISLLCIYLIFNQNISNWYINGGTIIFIYITSIYFLALVDTLFKYNLMKNNISKTKKHSSTFIINENGIEDTSEECNIIMKWNGLSMVIIAEYGIYIFSNSTIYFMLPINVKDKVLTSINKYNTNKELKIIIKETK